MRDSFIFYKSFYEAIKNIPKEDQLELYNALCEYSFAGNISDTLTGIALAMFTLMKPNIDNANARYKASVENGKKGGRPKKNKNLEKPSNNLDKTQGKPNQNLNVYEDVYVDVDDNDNVDVYVDDNIFELIEQNFGRTLNSIEYEEISKWENNDLTRYAIKQAVLNNKYNIKYISRIIESYKLNNIKTVQQAEEERQNYKNKKSKKETIDDIFERLEKEGKLE